MQLASRPSPEMLERWDEMLKEGMSYKEIGLTTGFHGVTVANYFPGRGWTHAQCVEMGTFMKHHNQKMKKVAPSYV